MSVPRSVFPNALHKGPFIHEHKTFDTSSNFISQLLSLERCPNYQSVGVFGGISVGKTALIDHILSHNHELTKGFSNTHKLCSEMCTTTHISFTTALGSTAQGKSALLTLVDTPGHADLFSAATHILPLIDVGLYVVDVVEGVNIYAHRMIRELMSARVPIIFVINKIDKLFLEQKMAPENAFNKLNSVVNDLHSIVKFDTNNLALSCLNFNCLFTLDAFRAHYSTDAIGWDSNFPDFVLQPLFKLMSFPFRYEAEDLPRALKRIGFTVTNDIIPLSVHEKVSYLLRLFLGGGWIESILVQVDPRDTCPEKPMMVLLDNDNAYSVCRFARRVNRKNFTLGSRCIPDCELFIPQGRAYMPVDSVPAGVVCCICGIHSLPHETNMGNPMMTVSIAPEEIGQYHSLAAHCSLLELVHPSVSVTKNCDETELSLAGGGEFDLNVFLHDLSFLMLEGNQSFIVSDPQPVVRETVTIISQVSAETISKYGNFVLRTVAEPHVRQRNEPSSYFRSNVLSVSHDCLLVMAIVPVESTKEAVVEAEMMRTALKNCKKTIDATFERFVKYGPLTRSRVSGCMFHITGFERFSQGEIDAAELSEALTNSLTAAFYLAEPRFLLSEYLFEVICPTQKIKTVRNIVERRPFARYRTAHNIVGTSLSYLQFNLISLDAIGMEVDIRAGTNGAAYINKYSSQFMLLNADPLDARIVIEPLAISSQPKLGRELYIRLRGRRAIPQFDMERYVSSETYTTIKSLGL
ncbi:hypothetical protein PCE1_001723 [Barthelona sp. PCE]